MHRIFLVCAVALAAAQAVAAAGRPKLTREQIERRKLEHFGGHVVQPVPSKPIALVDETGRTAPRVLAGAAASMNAALGYDVRVGDAQDAGVTVKVVRSDRLGALTVMPEDGVAVVNLAALAADRPSEGVLDARLEKELWRGLVYALGGGNTLFSRCVMKPIATLKELDALAATAASPETFARVRDGAAARGVRAARRVTYRQACREGWAPAPTNDVQRAIWEQVRSEKERGPVNGIRIAPPNAKR